MLKLTCIREKIWHLHFDKHYDLALHFFRYTENNALTLVDLMDKYSNSNGKDGVFSYVKDWGAFNLPGEIIFQIHKKGIPDINRYDYMMLAFAEFIKAKEGNDDFYLIGTSEEDESLRSSFNHELAHCLYMVDDKYRVKVINLINELPTRTRNNLFDKLVSMGYDENDYDEVQAYLATGSCLDSFNTKSVKEHSKVFERLFRRHAGRFAK